MFNIVLVSMYSSCFYGLVPLCTSTAKKTMWRQTIGSCGTPCSQWNLRYMVASQMVSAQIRKSICHSLLLGFLSIRLSVRFCLQAVKVTIKTYRWREKYTEQYFCSTSSEKVPMYKKYKQKKKQCHVMFVILWAKHMYNTVFSHCREKKSSGKWSEQKTWLVLYVILYGSLLYCFYGWNKILHSFFYSLVYLLDNSFHFIVNTKGIKSIKKKRSNSSPFIESLLSYIM